MATNTASTPINESIRDCFERIVKALRARPGLGQQVRRSVTRIDAAMTCESWEGDVCIRSDMPTLAGGRGEHPTPGMLARAAFGSCLVMGYRLRAAHQGIEIRSLEIEVQADDDENGIFGTSDVSAGYAALRYIVRIETDMEEPALTAFLDECDQHSPQLANYVNALRCERRIERVATTVPV